MHSFLNAIVKLKTVVKFILKCNCEIKNSCEIHLLVWTVFIGQSQGVAVNIVLLQLHFQTNQIRRQDSERQNNLLSSFSMEYINSSNVLCCVRDSNELLQAKLVCPKKCRLITQINYSTIFVFNSSLILIFYLYCNYSSGKFQF